MGMVARPQGIASGYVVFFGGHGDVTRQARERDVSRQRVYREADHAAALLEGTAHRAEIGRLHEQVEQLRQRVADLEAGLSQAVVIDDDRIARFAALAQAVGVSFPTIQSCLQCLLLKRAPSVAKLGRLVKAVAVRIGALLPVLDEVARPLVKQVSADEIYVKKPVLMVVEPDSMCWLTGSLTSQVTGEVWVEQFAALPGLEQVTRDAGSGLSKGVKLLNAARRQQGLPAVPDQLDQFHSLREAGRGLRKASLRMHQTFAKAELAQQDYDHQRRQGLPLPGQGTKVLCLWKRAEQAMDHVEHLEQAWQKTQEALRLFTPTGELNSRARAETVLAEPLPKLPDADFAQA